jgi:Rrf2 family iron-sulfur cluster assembly transcriptional regulator
VDLRLSRRADYALRAAIALGRAYDSGEYRKVREVAAEMGLPLQYTPQILNILQKAGLAESRAGQKGGYRLLRPPAELSLLQLIEAAEGPLWPQRCALAGGPCYWVSTCAVHPAWEKAYAALSAALAATTLASILHVDAELKAGAELLVARGHPQERERSRQAATRNLAAQEHPRPRRA